uniref:Tyrosine-protein phosphatase domain-containing protein n=2 Tax=Ascaris lumbricoides TaxID=6252 RepID=A0A0M3IJZ2_ASCLU
MLISYLCVRLESGNFERSFSSCVTIDSSLTTMGPKPKFIMLISYLCVRLESGNFERSFSSCVTIDSSLTTMGPKPKFIMLISYLCVRLESGNFERSFSSCVTIDSSLTTMGPKPKRRVMTRGRNECSVELDAPKLPTRRGGRQKLTTRAQLRRLASAEPRAPIGKKFVHKSASDGSYSSQRKNGPIEEWMNSTAELGVRGVRKEFVRDIKGYVPSGSQSAWESDKNFDKNRYEDIRLLDKTRVIIKKAPSDDDYIHASYVKVDENLTYICAQGPLENTVQNFWIMIIQEESKVVLQLCQMRENGKEQSAEYFPKNSTTKNYGAVLVKVKEKPTHAIGLKSVTRSKIQATYEGKTQEVLHILYAGWPDHCVADSPTVCCGVRNLVHKNYDKKPVIVHCSAGVGR